MNCPRWIVPLLPDARFCGSCGFTIVAAEPQVRTQGAPASPPPTQQYQAPGGAFHFDTDGRGQGRGYTWAIEHQGVFALAVVNLQPEQGIHAEAGAMVSMSSNVDLFSEMKGGVFSALKRAVGGESAFVSTFTAKGGPGEVTFAPGAPGDVAGIEMQNQTFMVQSSSYLAGDMSLTVDTEFGPRGCVIKLTGPTSGARRAGLLPGDRVLRVDDVPVEQIGLQEAMTRIRGEPGTPVRILVWRPAAGVELDVVVHRTPL